MNQDQDNFRLNGGKSPSVASPSKPDAFQTPVGRVSSPGGPAGCDDAPRDIIDSLADSAVSSAGPVAPVANTHPDHGAEGSSGTLLRQTLDGLHFDGVQFDGTVAVCGGSDGRARCAPEIEPEENSGACPPVLLFPEGEHLIEHQPSPILPPVGRVSSTGGPYTTRRTSDEAIAQQRAVICQRFLVLTDAGYSLNQAAAALGKSPSWFSGHNSMLSRYQRDGLAGLLGSGPATSSANLSDLTRQIEALPWFIPAAQFFYLISNRTHATGSVPEAVRRVISFPNLPTGWTNALRDRLLRTLNTDPVPTFPAALREAILAREKSGAPLIPERLARRVRVNPSVVAQFRSPREWSLANQSAPGSQRRFYNKATNERQVITPGDWFGGDDATPGIAVCVPCTEVRTPSTLKYGVLIGRYQWLAYHDAGCDKLLASDYIVRPRGSYRAEDILNGMGAVTRAHGIPRQGWQFEGGSWNSKLVRQAINLLGCEHWRTYSPHQKAVESVFNRVWTRLAVQFPHADMGRYRNENEANCHLYEDCKAGHKDPRKYFPTLAIVVKVFEEEVTHHNAHKINSTHYGQWIPDEIFATSVATNPLRPLSRQMDWIFHPYSVARTVRGMLVTCRVPMFENFSVPFEFGADWLPHYNAKKVRLHFNPREPKCLAKVVLLENATSPAGRAQTPETVLGDAKLISETAGHIRYLLDWATDDQRAGYLQRQRVAAFVRRETRAVGPAGRVEYSKSEERTIDTTTTIQRGGDRPDAAASVGRVSPPGVPQPEAMPRAIRPASDRRAELAALRAEQENIFV